MRSWHIIYTTESSIALYVSVKLTWSKIVSFNAGIQRLELKHEKGVWLKRWCISIVCVYLTAVTLDEHGELCLLDSCPSRWVERVVFIWHLSHLMKCGELCLFDSCHSRWVESVVFIWHLSHLMKCGELCLFDSCHSRWVESVVFIWHLSHLMKCGELCLFDSCHSRLVDVLCLFDSCHTWWSVESCVYLTAVTVD